MIRLLYVLHKNSALLGRQSAEGGAASLRALPAPINAGELSEDMRKGANREAAGPLPERVSESAHSWQRRRYDAEKISISHPFRRFSDLARMYSLCNRVDGGLVELKAALEKHIEEQGASAIEKSGDTAINVCFAFFG